MGTSSTPDVKRYDTAEGDGRMIGANAADLITFHGKALTSGAQAAAITAPAATAATNSSPYGYSQAQADALITAVRAIIVVLQNKGFTL